MGLNLDREYIVIRNPKYIAGTKEKPIFDFIIQRNKRSQPMNTDFLEPGQIVWLKWTSGPIVLKADIVDWKEGIVHDGNIDELKTLVRKITEFDNEEYWDIIKEDGTFNYILFYITNQILLEKPINTNERSHGSSWIVIDTPEKKMSWFSENIDNNITRSCPTIPIKKNKKIQLKAYMDRIIPSNNIGIKLDNIYDLVLNEFGEDICQPDISCPHGSYAEYKHAVRSVLDIEQKKGNYRRIKEATWAKIHRKKAEIHITPSVDKPPDRIKTTTTRIIRDSKIAQELKELYENKCQICNESFQYTNSKSEIIEYSEACHIKPLGKKHKGFDMKNNILILCPNHHAMFDLGTITINPYDSQSLIYLFSERNKKTKIKVKHNINLENINYHLKKIFNNGKEWEM